jgi:tRNA threonylcarbamoyladenosine biosynthesis protein TsaB
MKILAIEASNTAVSIALQIDDRITAEHVIAPLQGAKLILPMIAELLTTQKLTLQNLDAIAFGCGPGSFTGVRIATCVAQGLAYAANVPIIAISSLAALAQTAYQELQCTPMLVAIDARLNEIYCGYYRIEAGIAILVGGEQVCPPELLPKPLDTDFYGIGNAWEIFAERLVFKPAQINTMYIPTAIGVLKQAIAKFQQGDWQTALEATPIYLREQVAIKNIKNC